MAERQTLERDPEWEIKLRPHFVEVAENLFPRRNRLSSLLYSAGLLREKEEEEFTKSEKAESDLAMEILRVLRTHGRGSFNTFCNVLLQVGDGALGRVEKFLRSGGQDRKRTHTAGEESLSKASRGQSDPKQGLYCFYP